MPAGIGPSDCARQCLSTWPAANPHTLQLPLASVQSATRWSGESQLRQPTGRPVLRAPAAPFSAATRPTGS
eukprot:5244047-Prymnesium_polylepis.1